ncbi:MAG TPA: PQQ-dependent sugar dehydrogenase [Sporichthyaceae bacterium]|nr:PQQ-dependent sugar dehydrogenase [Sporichthyaceae bacterium]
MILRRGITAALGLMVAAGCTNRTASAPPSPELSASASATGSATPPTAPHHPHVLGEVTTGLVSPWGLAFLPDGSALVSQRDDGTVLHIDSRGVRTEVGVVPGVVHIGEGGLLGIAVAPDFATEPYLYAYETTATDNRIVRMRYREKALGEPTVLLSGLAKAEFHNGGRIAFGPDGMLYVGTGDATDTGHAQDKTSLNGKILRLRPDGSVPPDNPFPGSSVWSYGHRNVQGLAWDPAGNLFASEFGLHAWDELNLIRPGANYGWPTVEGFGGTRQGYTDPLRAWHTKEASPSGVAFLDGSVWMAALKGTRLWEIPMDGTTPGDPQAWFTGTYGRLRTVAVAPDGQTLWLMTDNTDGRGVLHAGDDRIVRVALR